MTSFEELVRDRLRREAMTPAPSDLLDRAAGLLDEQARPGKRSSQWVVAACSAAVVAVVALSLSYWSGGPFADSPARPSASSSTGGASGGASTYPQDDLDAAIYSLLEASRDGKVPVISYARSAADQSGIIVAVPRQVISDYGSREKLAAIFGEHAGLVVVDIEVAEVPSNGLPISPASPG